MVEEIKIPLFKIYWDNEDVASVNKTIKRGSYWATGPEIVDFEEKLAKYVGTKYAVLFNSGTSGQHAILTAMGIKSGDEVIVPSYTFISTANSVIFTGAKPVLTDIEKTTFGLDINQVKKNITKKTKAIIPVHYAGCPCLHMQEIKELAEKKDIMVVEDAAASLGGSINGKKTGTFSDAAMFSFCQNKIITTGEGGAIVTDSDEIYEKLKLLVSHGRGKEYIALGYNFRMPSMNAALGISQLNKIEKILSMRKTVAENYTKNLEDIKNINPFIPPKGFDHTYWIYSVLIENGLKEKVRKHLLKKGVFSKLYYEPIHLTKFYQKKYSYKKGDLPVTEEVCNKSLSLPMYPGLTKEEINYITNCIIDILG